MRYIQATGGVRHLLRAQHELGAMEWQVSGDKSRSGICRPSLLAHLSLPLAQRLVSVPQFLLLHRQPL